MAIVILMPFKMYINNTCQLQICLIIKQIHKAAHNVKIVCSKYVSKFLLNKSHISEYGIYFSMLKGLHLITLSSSQILLVFLMYKNE